MLGSYWSMKDKMARYLPDPGSMFCPMEKNSASIVRFGMVKGMSVKYGISYLIEAYALAKQSELPPSELVLVGGGEQELQLRELSARLGIADSVKFVGPVPHVDVAKWLASFDVYAALSEAESFGVAIIEASACGIPVVVSNAGGLPEVVVDGVTGFVVPRKDPQKAAEKLILLANDPDLRRQMGMAGRQFVVNKYKRKMPIVWRGSIRN